MRKKGFAGVWAIAEVYCTQGTSEQKLPLRILLVLELRVRACARTHTHTHTLSKYKDGLTSHGSPLRDYILIATFALAIALNHFQI